MPINEEFLDKFKTGLINKINRCSIKRSIRKHNLIELNKLFNDLSKYKQLELIEELFDIQREFIIECAKNEQTDIEIPKLGRIRIRPCKKDVVRLQDEGRRAGKSYKEVSQDIAKHIRNYKEAKKNETKVITPKFIK